MVVTVFLLVAVLLFGDERLGANRSLLSGSIQPSELAKIVVVIYLAVWLDNRRDQLKDVSFGLIPLGTILGIIGGLIALQPDLSAVLTVFILGGMLFFLAGGDVRQIFALLILGGAVGFLIAVSDIFPTGRERIIEFINGMRDPMRSSDHVMRSLEAFANGGVWGGGGAACPTGAVHEVVVRGGRAVMLCIERTSGSLSGHTSNTE